MNLSLLSIDRPHPRGRPSGRRRPAPLPFCYADPKTSSWLLALWLLARGIGLGAVTISVTAVAYLGLDRAQVPHASVLTRTAQLIGGSFGFAALAAALSLWLPRRPRPASPLAPAAGRVNSTTVSGAARS
jgi:hypothetical protein